jgi:hypothetical protein
MPNGTQADRAVARVAIVAGNVETLDGLAAYLRSLGFPCRTTRFLNDLTEAAPDDVAAVIFPDDFGHVDVTSFLRELRQERPRLLALLVTREPSRFKDVVAPDGRSPSPLVFARPTFGWEISDAIRTHTEKGWAP